MPSERSTPQLTQELIFLDRDDDLASIKAKLESTSADQVFLALPRRSHLLKTPLEFRMLARLAHETSTETVIVTADGDRRRMARDEGFRTRGSLGSVGHLMRPAGSWGFGLPMGLELPLPSLGAIFSVAVMLGALGLLNFYILPVMTVELSPQTETVRRELVIVADPRSKTSDPARGLVAGQTVESTFQVVGTSVVEGTRAVGKDKARGEVLLSNNGAFLSLAPGTVVLSKSGQRFVIDAETPLPAGARNARASVTAAEPGAGGNVGAGEINAMDASVPRNVTVTNQRPTTGGTDREGKIITADDATKLRDQLTKRANEQALRQLQTAAGETRTVPPQSVTVRVLSEQFDPPVGADADQFSGRMSLRAVGTSFENKDFNTVVTQSLLGDLRQGMIVAGGGPRIGVPEVLGVEEQRIRLRVQASAQVIREIDAEQVRSALAGLTVAEARSELSGITGLTDPPVVKLWPSWAARAYRVEVEVAGPR